VGVTDASNRLPPRGRLRLSNLFGQAAVVLDRLARAKVL
jgi:hypothetical protein